MLRRGRRCAHATGPDESRPLVPPPNFLSGLRSRLFSSSRRPVRPAERAPPGTKQRGIGSCRFARLVEASSARAPIGSNNSRVARPLATTSFGASVHAASSNNTSHSSTAAADATPHQLKAVFIVGPTGTLTSMDLTDAESLAEVAESYGMDVRRVFFPHATWDERAGQHPGREPRRVHGPRLRLAQPVYQDA